MSWGDAWVCSDTTRPTIGADGPQSPWVSAGVISSEERSFVEATQKLRSTRDKHARAVEFFLQIHTREVALDRSGSVKAAFNPDGLWLAVDVTPAGDQDAPRYVYFAQRVHPIVGRQQAPKPAKGARRPIATVHLRGRARAGVSALEWAYRAPSAR